MGGGGGVSGGGGGGGDSGGDSGGGWGGNANAPGQSNADASKAGVQGNQGAYSAMATGAVGSNPTGWGLNEAALGYTGPSYSPAESVNDLGYSYSDYTNALANVPTIDRVSGGPLGLGPIGDAQRTPGGILSGGPLNGWGTLGTLAGFAVPGLAPAMGALALGNMALGAYNSTGIGPNTGELASPRSVMSGLADSSGLTGLLSKVGGQPNSTGSSTNTAESGAGQPSMGGQDNQPARDPAVLASITGLPASVFGGTKVSPYAAARRTPELQQGLLQRSLWGAQG